MNFDYTVTTQKDFESAVAAVESQIVANGFRVLYIHDVQKDVAEKGFTLPPFKIIELCNAKYATEFLNAEIKIGLCMPCKINVYQKDGKTYISSMQPGAILPTFFPQANLGEKPAEVDKILRDIIDKAK